jgi:PAS domain S-box-containing protein
MTAPERLRTIFDGMRQPVLLIDRSYTVVEANAAARAHTVHDDPVVIGMGCYETTHDLEQPCWHSGEVSCPVKQAFETGQRARAIHKHRVGDRLIVEEIAATPIVEADGSIEYVVEEFRDLTELLDLREGILPICASCKRIRDHEESWLRIEEYIHVHTGADFSHSLCPDCFERQFGD